MKNIILPSFALSILLVLCLHTAFAQRVKMQHKDEFIRILSGTDFYLKGILQDDSTNTKLILNQSNFYITDSIYNHGNLYIFGTLPDTLGNVILEAGDTSLGIKYKGIYFSNLKLNNALSTVYLDADTISVTRQLEMTAGKIHLNKRQIFMRRTNYGARVLLGQLLNESNNHYIYGKYPGFVKLYRPLLLGNTYADMQGLGLSLSIDGNLGTRTEIRRFSDDQTGASNGSILRYFELIPQIVDQVSAPTLSYLPTPELNGNTKADLRFYLSQDGGLAWRDKGGTSDTANNKVSTTGFNQFFLPKGTRFTLSEDSCDVLPYVDIPQDTFPLCSGASVYLSADSVGDMEVMWSTNVSGLDSILVSAPGTFWVKVTNSSGCVNYDTCHVVQAPDPVAGFYADPHCLGDSAVFVDTSSISSGTFTYSWNFGDPFNAADTSTDTLPKYLYTKFGNFTAQLIATSNYGCQKTAVRQVTVLPNPEAKFSASSHCADSLVSFTNQTSVPGNLGISYVWYFGDGDTSIVAAPTHAFGRDTTFTVKLVARSQGCVDSTSNPLVIYPNPNPKFKIQNACPGQSVTLIDSSKINSGTFTYLYQLGNGQTSMLSQPIVSYATSGNYYLSLTLNSDKNCKATFRDTLLVHPRPIANFTALNGCANDSLSFVNGSTLSAGAFNSLWFFGDGNTASSTSPKHAYTNALNYTAKLKVVSDSGCTDSTTRALTVYPNPVAGFSNGVSCEGDLVNFSNSSTLASGTMSYKWYFGNGDTSVLSNPATTYSTPGAANVLLVAVSGMGCIDSLSQTLTVNTKPVLTFGANISTCGNSLELDAGNAGSQYLWSNGRRTQKITATSNGTYSVTVTNPQMCSRSDTTQITLNTAVQVNLGPDKSVCDSIQLQSGYGGTSATALWNGSFSGHALPVTTSGTYSVVVTDVNNCQAADTVNITVNASPVLDLGTDINACADSVFALISNVSTAFYLWSTGSTSNQIIPNKTGTYRLTVTDANNCSDQDEINVTFRLIPTFSLGPDKSVCDSVTLQITNPQTASYQWSTGATGITTTVMQSGLVWALATSASNCAYADTISIVVNASPQLNLGQDTTLCFGNSLEINAGISALKYQWNTGDTAQKTTILSSQKVVLAVRDTFGCKDTDTISVVINPLFEVNLGPDLPLCSNNKPRIAPGFAKARYQWAGPNNFTSTDTSIILEAVGVYSVRIIDSAGCRATDTLEALFTNMDITADFTSAEEVTMGDNVAFLNLSYPQPDKQLWILPDGFTSPAQHLFYPFYREGEYIIKLAVSNSLCSDTLAKKLKVKPPVRSAEANIDSVETYIEILDLALYPNPTRDILNIRVKLTGESIVIIEFLDLSGRIIDAIQSEGSPVETTYNSTNLNAGLYFVRARAYNSSLIKKFIKIN
jgi:PKD repeat protein